MSKDGNDDDSPMNPERFCGIAIYQSLIRRFVRLLK